MTKTHWHKMTPRAHPRRWQLGFAAFAVVAIVILFPGEDAVLPTIRTMGVIGYAVAAAVSLGCAAALPKQGARRLLIGFHLAFVPMQFLFAFPNPVPNLGMALSVGIVVGLRPRFPRLSQRARKIWLVLHIGISVGWLGLSLGMLTLALTGSLARTHAVRHGAYEIFHVFDLVIVIPSVVLTIVTGLVLSLGTPWGLVKHRWVLTKFLISLAIPGAAAVESRWVTELVARTEDPATEPGALGVALAVTVGCFAISLWTATILSVLKPWGRTRWGRDAGSPSTITVTVTDRGQVAEDTVALTLEPVGDRDLPPWEPGAHVDLILPSGLIRQYSLCGDPAETRRYRLAVLREPGGRGGSLEAHTLHPGTRLEIRGPRNNFPIAEAPAHLLIAGGIGITPFLPMLPRLTAAGVPWRLVYRGRSLDRMAYAGQLEAAYPGRVSLHPADTHPRPDLAELVRRLPAGAAVYCCGPTGLIEAVAQECPHGTLHVERFASTSREGSRHPFDAELRRSGRTVRVPADGTLLAALHEVDPGLPASCTNGVCGSCRTPVLDGVPDHRDDVLQPHERDRTDVVYPCVSRARGDKLVLDV
ncbi:PDR/VanB family oxidoreductase [Amycolatopsis azurea]|uniref:Vanillate O-demethylase oxidoreductase n=2 Tax=Amycolatopsis azurea DSM 43854 TaxID=1238180 RepID=M2Q9J1_9PSEU|nr:PDR/VanB family oxidoreductase [Amycolatopsis azurea]EMD22742.1 Vanillate O-demethylase oxidoreductase [Amycolatopsis azurea DSM 43854]